MTFFQKKQRKALDHSYFLHESPIEYLLMQLICMWASGSDMSSIFSL